MGDSSILDRDVQRHLDRLADRLRRGVNRILREESIVSKRGGDRVRIPIHDDVDRARIRFVPEGDDPWAPPSQGLGQGPAQPGDVVGYYPRKKSGKGKEAGDEHRDPDYWVEMTVDELAEWLFSVLRLPRILPSRSSREEEVDPQLDSRARKGPDSRLDRRRSVLDHLKREVVTGDSSWHDEDLHYRRFREVPRPSWEAAVVLVRDISGSMGEEETRAVQIACWWIVRWLRHEYPHVRLHWVVHDTAAVEVDEEQFFHTAIAGGTIISSGLHLGREILERYPDANRYLVFFSDGYNFPTDNDAVVEELKKLLPMCDLVGYGELHMNRDFIWPANDESRLSAQLAARRESGELSALRTALLDPADLAGFLQTLFAPEQRGRDAS